MDSILIAAEKAFSNGVGNLRERYMSLTRDPQYLDWVTSDTSDERILIGRIKMAIAFLAE
jgi:hypothetical protein